ncbi:MAG: sulfatase-like hydrolase/transferase [Planctomycetota bacterium]|nr:sulfatase-like hydrolase/transferase [Planctomycetota bacterium]MDA1164726.1 sulfatase-like hydrolase/transferase [Planctomycetota bacterium]
MNRLQVCVAFAVLVAAPHVARSEKQPNVVLIISDDQTYSDFGFMGNADVLTPNLDRLASQSARYVNGYVPSSVCRPSLVSILTGLYPHQHGIYFNHPPPGFGALTRSPDIGKAEFDAFREEAATLIRTVPTLPLRLAASGYRCFQTGKYWEGHWKNAGFTEGMTTAEPSPGAKNGNKTLANGDVVAHGNGDHGLTIGRETMQPIYDFIDDCNETPFMVWYAPFLPHTPHDSPKKYFDLYQDRTSIPKHRVPYYAAISQFDDTVGNLLNFVDERGLTNDTIFVFVVDNGWEADLARYRSAIREWDHTKRSKRAPFDFGLRTPILIRWSGRTKAATYQAPVSSIDLLPTLLAATRIATTSEKWPGQNLWPSATGSSLLDSDRAVFGEIYPGDATSLGHPEKDVAHRWVRKGNLKLITTHKQGAAQSWGNYLDGDAVFDVVADPTESRNLIERQKLLTEILVLRRLLDDWWNPGSH